MVLYGRAQVDYTHSSMIANLIPFRWRLHFHFYSCFGIHLLGVIGNCWITLTLWTSDTLFPYRSPSPRPHPDPTQRSRNGPETDPKRTRNRPKRTRNQALWGGTAGGFVGRGGGGGCKGKRKSLLWRLHLHSLKLFSK